MEGGGFRWKLDEGRLSGSTGTSTCDCAQQCWDEATTKCDGFYYNTQTKECVLMQELAKGIMGPPQRFEAEVAGAVSFRYEVPCFLYYP